MIKNIIKIILLGSPGSGKGTIASVLKNQLNMNHISTGDLFRNSLDNNDELSHQIRDIMSTGGLIPDDITNKLAKDAIIKSINEKKSFILDGYPRTLEQAKYLSTVCEIDNVIYLNIDEQILLKRIIGRRSCKKCKEVYNIYFKKPIIENECDKCHLPLFTRKDDNEESFALRINEYKHKTQPLIDFYKQKNKLVEIDSNQNIEKIVNTIKQIV